MRLINHKYLKEIGVTPVQYSYIEKEFPGIFQRIKGRIRRRKYQRTQIRTGFNPAETWDLERSFYQWLYEGLRSYIDYASEVIDLDAEWIPLEYMGKSYTQRQFIELLLEKLELVLCSDVDWQYAPSPQEILDEYKRHQDLGNEIHDMWKILAPYAGW